MLGGLPPNWNFVRACAYTRVSWNFVRLPEYAHDRLDKLELCACTRIHACVRARTHARARVRVAI